jgi:transglutaminase-like putative cysteine protease
MTGPRPRRLHVRHHTAYRYEAPVAQSWQLAHLTPRSLPWQRVLAHRLVVAPAPDWRDDRTDAFGNSVTTLAIHGPHESLDVDAESTVEVTAPTYPADALARPWRLPSYGGALPARGTPVARATDGDDGDDPGIHGGTAVELAHFLGPSPLVPRSRRAALYARGSFRPGAPFGEALDSLVHRIHRDFRFDPKATTVTTPLEQVFARRRGVCQDFAQLMIACLRAVRVPARYVSGYIVTRPPPGRPRLVGADASHAWVSAWCAGAGWVDVDPTNDRRVDQDFVTLGWGRDFSDVTPLRGVILGGGAQHLEAKVTVTPLDDGDRPGAALSPARAA